LGSRPAPDLADLAHKWGLPLTTVVDSSKLFSEYATLPGEDQDEHVFREGVLRVNGMMELASKLAKKASVDDMCVSPREIMGVVDRNMDGTVDFHEFAIWYHERGFEEYMNLSRTQIEVRRIGRRMGVEAADMDAYKLQFDKFDADGSGFICLAEFKELVNTLMKVPKGHELPESRMRHFWKEADSDGNKQICLEEFVAFYTKHFNSGSICPVEDYYKDIRRVTIAGAPPSQ